MQLRDRASALRKRLDAIREPFPYGTPCILIPVGRIDEIVSEAGVIAEVATMHAENKNAYERINDLEFENRRLAKDLAEASDRARNAFQEVERLKEEVDSYRVDIMKLDREHTALLRKVGPIDKERNRLMGFLAKLNESATGYQACLDQLENFIAQRESECL